ncbi:hypothetical protein DS043_26345 [Escherichia coli]|nr:hypothetical protein [Escherichia coli]EFP6926912.1 hypothetical protein [Shigella dysenteriae]EJF5753622.1 hypothetical protein [Shigella sonnei]EFO2174685.1 hypothetical protein [Escherichia coli]EFO4691390.1 hypothetical protein [Escherichia coli]
MIEAFSLTLYLIFLLKHKIKKRVITTLSHLVFFNCVFFLFVFGGSTWNIIESSYMLAPFALSFIINTQVILALLLRNKGGGGVLLSSFLPPFVFSIWNFNLIIPAHPLMIFYQFDFFYKILPRFDNNIINIIIIYIIPFIFLLQIRKLIIVLIIMGLCFFINWNLVEQKKMGVKILVVQTDMFLSKHKKIANLKEEIFKYDDADIIIFSESPAIGFKEGSRTVFTRDFIDEIKTKKDGKLYILNNYGFVNGEQYNYNLSLYIMNGSIHIKAKRKLVPFWETPSLFYRKNDWKSPYFSVPSETMSEKYKFRNIYINSYICYEGLFANTISIVNDLTIIQSNYESFSKGYDRVVKNGNVLAYVNKSSGFKNFISVQNMGGTIFVDNKGKFHWNVYETSKKKAIFLLEI